MKDESQKKNFLLWIIMISILLGIILAAVSAIVYEMKTEKYPNTINVGTELDYSLIGIYHEVRVAGYNGV